MAPFEPETPFEADSGEVAEVAEVPGEAGVLGVPPVVPWHGPGGAGNGRAGGGGDGSADGGWSGAVRGPGRGAGRGADEVADEAPARGRGEGGEEARARRGPGAVVVRDGAHAVVEAASTAAPAATVVPTASARIVRRLTRLRRDGCSNADQEKHSPDRGQDRTRKGQTGEGKGERASADSRGGASRPRNALEDMRQRSGKGKLMPHTVTHLT
ncbi:hypothetical protein GCM10020219_075300 [Nonomuraea dietziae]